MRTTDLGFLRLEPDGPPLFQQIYAGVRDAILRGQLPRGTRLPATRALAGQLQVSRTTVVTAFEQLVSEGYLFGRVGAGTFVTTDLPEDGLLVRRWETAIEGSAGAADGDPGPAGTRAADTRVRGSRGGLPKARDHGSMVPRGRTGSETGRVRAFEPGVPALDEFPLRLWAQLHRRCLSSVAASDLSYGSPAGHGALREAIATHLRAHRGVRCDAAQVMVVSGTQQAIDVILRVLTRPGESVYFEDPGYPRARNACLLAGVRLRPLPVDGNGARVPAGTNGGAGAAGDDARLAYLTPSHQYPLGVTLSIERRLEFLDWARRSGRWIIEDDYDSEYRFRQRPIPALQGLDSAGRTFYVGSFSKVLFPSLSMGYLIAPTEWTEEVARVLSLVSRPPSRLDQLTLLAFLEEGHFGRHLRRMRSIHEARRAALVEAITRRLAGAVEILGDEAGLHLAVRILGRKSDRTISKELRERGVIAPPLSDYYAEDVRRGRSSSRPEEARRIRGLVLGYGGVTPTRIPAAVQKMAEVLEAAVVTPRASRAGRG